MSYDLYLCHPVSGDAIEISHPHHMTGGTYRLGGETELHLNITYNYGKHYRRVMGSDGIRAIYGKTGLDSLPILDQGIAALGDDVDGNYWKPTEGNAKAALIQLRTMARMRPDGIWNGD